MKLRLDTNVLVAAVTRDTDRSDDAIDATLVSFDSELIEHGAKSPTAVR
ncbi:hypothetical protein [Halalkaliarchaeum sp. AArc-CO]|nr:hypothetical protein [Halalkaliarchaeum sp. AArc-CO]